MQYNEKASLKKVIEYLDSIFLEIPYKRRLTRSIDYRISVTMCVYRVIMKNYWVTQDGLE